MKGKSSERQNTSHSQNYSSRQSPAKHTKNKSLTQGATISEDFEDILMNISLKKPRSSYAFFLQEMHGKGNSSVSITEVSHEMSKKWKKMDASDKKKYDKLAEQDQERYQRDTALVRENILKKPRKENVTAYRIFVDDYVSKAIDNNEDSKDAREEAREKWNRMSDEQRGVYEDKRVEVAELYESLRTNKKTVSGFTIFMKTKMEKARSNNHTITLKEVAELWNKTKDSHKEKYEEYAQEIKEAREKQRDQYELAFGIKPRRPLGAYKFFVMEKAKEGKLEGKNPFIEAAKLWENTTDEGREYYQRIAKKEQLAYIVKKMEYNSLNRKDSGIRAPSAFNLFVSDMQGKVSDPEGGMFKYSYNKWLKTDTATKNKYKKRAEEEKEKFAQRKEEFKNRTYEAPKRPSNPYNRFLKYRISQLLEDKPKETASSFFGIIGEEWKNLNEKKKDKYYEAYKKDNEIYKEQMEFFNENRYYIDSSKTERGKSQSNRSSSKFKGENRSTKKGKVSAKN